MGNSCSCKGCVISCINKYSDCKDYINKEGKYNEKKPSDIKIVSSINIQNILKTITIDTNMERNEDVPISVVETKEVEAPKPQLTIKIDEQPINTEILVAISDKVKNSSGKVENLKYPLVKNNKNSEDEFEII